MLRVLKWSYHGLKWSYHGLKWSYHALIRSFLLDASNDRFGFIIWSGIILLANRIISRKAVLLVWKDIVIYNANSRRLWHPIVPFINTKGEPLWTLLNTCGNEFPYTVIPLGFKPKTFRTGIWRSIQLSYGTLNSNVAVKLSKKNDIHKYLLPYFRLTSSLKKHAFCNLLINNILYLCVT